MTWKAPHKYQYSMGILLTYTLGTWFGLAFTNAIKALKKNVFNRAVTIQLFKEKS